VKDHIVDNIPVVGGLVRTVEAIAKGDWKGAAIGLGETLLDAALLVTTGGIGNLIKAGAKSGIKVAAKIIAKETGENIAQSAASETVSGAIGKPLPLWAEISLGVVVGIKPKDIGKKGKSGIKEGADEAGDAAAGKFTK